MIWHVDYTDEALDDLKGIYEYIAFTLLEPTTAANLTGILMDAADSLDHLPFRHPLYHNEPWRSKGLRFMPVENYAVFYIPVEATQTVTIIRIMYGARDIDKHLYSDN